MQLTTLFSFATYLALASTGAIQTVSSQVPLP